MDLLGILSLSQLQRTHDAWVDEALNAEAMQRQKSWTGSLAVGSQAFLARFQSQSGNEARHRTIGRDGVRYLLHKPEGSYHGDSRGEIAVLSANNAAFLDNSIEISRS